eukprot:TRINITY_DN7947_c0_g1_i1.p1 TRINITY_DN7947_c0_g1~~TRINITY_DN7947_c0_g1_i1.p1  ORF type:complete len:82 (+),score=35.62 TRINITY_DN7947_c0_g1_i1:52-297(+)
MGEKKLLTKSPALLKLVMLRRIKKEVEHSLPPKEEIIMKLPLSDVQLDIYTQALYQYANILNLVDGKGDKKEKVPTAWPLV